jgi:hypothetical protein
LFPKKEEGKIVMGGKDDGKVNFLSFGTTTKRQGKKVADGTHAIKPFHAEVNGKFGKQPYLYEKSKTPPTYIVFI